MEPHLLLALVLGFASIVSLIIWSRLDPFASLIVGSLVAGLVAHLPFGEVAAVQDLADLGALLTSTLDGLGDTFGYFTTGFGNTLADIGIVIVLGVMIGKVLEESGGADAMAKAFVRMAGRGREDVALTATGSVVSVPVFCDSGFVIMHPLARSLARRFGRPLVVMSLALGGGLAITHHMVPPTPGPLAATGILGADLGTVVLASILFVLPLFPVVVAYARIVGPRLEAKVDTSVVPGYTEDGRDISTEPADPQVGALRASLPLLLPLLLIVSNTFAEALVPGTVLEDVFGFVGEPAIALLLGLILALYLLPRRGTDRNTVGSWLTAAAASAGMIVFITGAGGAFGEVLRETGVGDALADEVSSWPLPLFLVPFLISTFMRIAQGSGTVAIIAGATLSTPLIEAGGLDPTLAVLAACAGSFVFSYVSDSYFWVVTRFTGLSGGAAMQMWTGMTTTLWLASIPLLGIAALVLG